MAASFVELGPRLIVCDRAAGLFFCGVMRFIGEHPLLGAAAAAALLAANLLDGGTLGADEALLKGLDLVEQKATSQETVQSLLAGCLALDLQTGWTVEQHDAGGGLVDVLAAVPAGADEGFFNVGFADAEGGHALGELGFFVQADGERVHASRIARKGKDGNRRQARIV